MLFRFGSAHWILGWLLTVLGLVALALAGHGYWSGATVRPGWVVGALFGIVAGTAIVRWAKRVGPD